ncbi:MAG: hypothetical protein NTV57_12250 [Cyanobacteria bacterium]|nr:hypothetical protein [Cyanobacteriota bacterium]
MPVSQQPWWPHRSNRWLAALGAVLLLLTLLAGPRTAGGQG